ncbi:PQQ-binding-like beta-propeller repeat protein [Actinotalea sp. Marseille-Q4924]|uniref:outer membrane protein assembly factor BamB family protein n=1 Tax=Actinotalea sp. Marseille-Q4924 TaxID=2866571 RepID=UPI001CE419B0|nr:PQQ-binding-like beta-propeller repeat protein [Actinotalea sp. Marseille-Q4924]
MGRGRAALGDGDVEVLLVDDDAPDQPAEARPAPGASRGPRGRRLARGAVVALVVVTAAGAAQAWQEQTAQAALAGVPGFVARMDMPPQVAWERDGYVRDAAGAMLLMHSSDGAATDLVDAATGAVLWSAQGPGADGGWGDCEFVREGAAPAVWGFSEDPADSVLCRTTTVRSGAPVSTRLQVLDARTGGLLAERTIRTEPTFVATLAGDVVHAGHDADGYLEVVRWDPDTDTDRWRYRSEQASGPGSRELSAGVVGDVVLVQNGGAVVLVSLDDGSVVHRDDLGSPRIAIARLADGTVDLRIPLDAPGAMTVTDRDGTVRWEAEAWFAGPQTLDPRTPVLLVSDDVRGVVAHDVRDGEVLWTRGAEGTDTGTWRGGNGIPLVQVAHRLVLATGGRLETLDARDGSTLWVAEDLGVSSYGAVSDGRSVIVPARSLGDRLADVLVALDVRDGHEVWRLELPWTGDTVLGVADTLVVEGVGGVVGLRP